MKAEPSPSIRKLKDFLEGQPVGSLSAEVGEQVIPLLVDCWDSLQGSDQEATSAHKLGRAKAALTWQPPILSFVIERHGATVLGSSRAALHCWEIDLDRGVASCDPNAGHRQLRAMAPRMNVKPIAKALAEDIVKSKTDHPALKWSADRTQVRILIGKLISGDVKQTISDRRKRFKKALQEALPGWKEVRPNLWQPR